MNNTSNRTTTLAWLGCLTLCGLNWETAALAQNTPAERVVVEREPAAQFSLGASIEHQFDTGVGSGGEFNVTRIGAGLGVKTNLQTDLDLNLRFSYVLDSYNFTGGAPEFGGTEPWEDIHTASLGAIFNIGASDDWDLFVGPVVQVARESGAEWSDGLTGGVVAGAAYHFNPDLTLGGGIGVVSQLEDEVRYFPIIIIDWRITDDLRLSTQAVGGPIGRNGVELIWSFADDWQAAVGAATEFRRFRLDDEGIAPNGVGEESNMPLWARLSHNLNNNVSLDLFAGFANSGELRLEDEDGDLLADDDYDTAGLVGANVRVRF